MIYRNFVVLPLVISLFVSAPAWTQEARPASTSPIQRLIAADQLYEQKDYLEAIRTYNELLSSDPNNAQILNRLGIAYQAIHKMHDAKKYYERALKADPKFAPAANNIGSIYYNDKRFAKAEHQYHKAIKLDPTVASFHSNLGYTYLAEKKYPQMMDSFHTAVSLDPSIFDTHNRSGAILQERGVEDRGAFYFYLAKTYGLLGDAPRCVSYLIKARDEHYKDILTVKTDPAFAPVRPKPEMKEFINGLTARSAQNPSSAN